MKGTSSSMKGTSSSMKGTSSSMKGTSSVKSGIPLNIPLPMRRLTPSQQHASSSTKSATAFEIKHAIYPVKPPQLQSGLARWRAYRGFPGLCRRVSAKSLRRLSRTWNWLYDRMPFVCWAAYAYVHLLLFSITLRAVSIFLFPFIWDWLSYWNFWVLSINDACSRAHATEQVNRTTSEQMVPYHHKSVVIDTLISFIINLRLLFRKNMSETTMRQYFAIQPPPFPLASHDYFWLQDTPQNSCQISGMAMTERLTIEEVIEVVMERWVNWDLKFSSVLRKKWGRMAWVPLNRKRDPPPNDPLYFQIASHIYEVHINLERTTIYEALSALASETLPGTRPRWRIVLLNPIQREGEENDYSCVAIQLHHGLGDGIAIAYAICGKLFDESTSSSSAFKPPTIKPFNPRLIAKTAAYYMWNTLKCALFGVRVLGFWLIWCPKPPATFQPPMNGGPAEYIQRQNPTGTKFLGPPVVLDMRAMGRLRDCIGTLTGAHVTVNDILAYCLSIVVGDLRSGKVARQLQGKITKRKNAIVSWHSPLPGGTSEGESPPPTPHRKLSSRLLFKQACEGTPIEPATIDISTPTALNNRLRHRGTPDPFVFKGASCIPTSSHSKLWQLCLREWLAKKDPNHHAYASNFDNYLQLLIPMNTRTSYPTGLDNFTGPVLLRLPLHAYSKRYYNQAVHLWTNRLRDIGGRAYIKKLLLSLKHLQAVKASIDEMKRSDYGPVFFLLCCLACKVMPDCISRLVVTATNDRMQMLLTNVIGPSELSSLHGKKIKSLQFWPPAKGEVTGGLAIFSFQDKLQVFSVFDEAEFRPIFDQEDFRALPARDRAGLSQYIANLMKLEFLTLYDLVVDQGVGALNLSAEAT